MVIQSCIVKELSIVWQALTLTYWNAISPCKKHYFDRNLHLYNKDLFCIIVMFPTFHNVWIAIYNILRYVTFNPVFWLEDTMRKIISERKVKQVRKKLWMTCDWFHISKQFSWIAESTTESIYKIIRYKKNMNDICLVSSQGHYGFHSFPVVDWFCLFIYLWVLTFPL